MQIVSRIYTGHKIKTQDEIFEVRGSQKFRSGYKYICRAQSDGRNITLDREDILQAQREGTAEVTL